MTSVVLLLPVLEPLESSISNTIDMERRAIRGFWRSKICVGNRLAGISSDEWVASPRKLFDFMLLFTKWSAGLKECESEAIEP